MFRLLGFTFTILVLFSATIVAILNWYSLGIEFEDPQNDFFSGIEKVEIIAHRGGALERPENTHMAFEYISRNFPEAIIELDVRITSDNHLVVMHDDTLDRTTNGSGRVSATTLDKLSKLNAGYNFEFAGRFPYRSNVYQQLLIPKLEDVFIKYSNRLIVEIKGSVDEQIRSANALASLIDNLKNETGGSYGRGSRYSDNINSLEQRLVVSSEIFLPIYQMRKKRPNWLFAPTKPEIAYKLIPLSKLGFLGADASIDQIFKLKSDVYCLPRKYRGKEVITEDLITELNRRKKPLYAWTINDEVEMEELIKMGINGIITDRPSVLKRMILRSLR